MKRVLLAGLLFGFGAACRTTTQSSSKAPAATWEAELPAGVTVSPKAATSDAEAVVFDFPKRRLVGLGGKVNTWLRWLDARAATGKVESLVNLATADAPQVEASIGDGKKVACALSPARATTALPASIFEASLVKADDSKLEGVHLKLGESEFGPLSIALEGEGCVLGADVLSRLVVLVPTRGKQPLWVLVPGE